MVLGRRLAVVLASASMVVGSFQVASAHESAVTSKVTIKVADGGGFKGKVKSSDKSCVKKRKVTVFKKRNDKKVGTTRTNKRGKWSLDLSNARGRYYAVVAEKSKTRYLHVHVCLGDRSAGVKA